MEQPQKAGYVDILGRQYRTSLVVNVLLWGPLLVWLLWTTFLVRAVKFIVDKIGSVDDNLFATLGQTGDLFGGVNALFAAYAFAGVAVAAYFQHKTFKVVEEQQRQQSFEPLFFKLLELNRHLRPDSLREPPNLGRAIMADGRTAEQPLEFIVTELSQDIVDPILRGDRVDLNDPAAIRKDVAAVYGRVYVDNEGVLGPYFRTLYHVFKLIDMSGLPRRRRVEYANIGRAALSRDELILLMFNCLAMRGREFKPLVDNYGLLKHLPTIPRDLRKFAKMAYAPTALMNSAEREKYWKDYPHLRPMNMPPEDVDQDRLVVESS